MAGKKHLLKKLQINKQKKNTNNVARASLVARRAAVDSRWTARGRTFTRRRRTNISIITIYPETFRTFPKDLIVHNHTLANSPPMYAMPQCMGTSEGQGKVFAAHSLLHLQSRTIAANASILFFHWFCPCTRSPILVCPDPSR